MTPKADFTRHSPVASLLLAAVALLAHAMACGGIESAGGPDIYSNDPADVVPSAPFDPDETAYGPSGGAVITLDSPDGGTLQVIDRQVLVYLAPTATRGQRDALENVITREGGTIIGQQPALGRLQVELAYSNDIFPTVQLLKVLPGVGHVGPNEVAEAQTQTHPPSGSQPGDFWMEAINIYQAWDVTVGSFDVAVGVIDTYLETESGHFTEKEVHIFESSSLPNSLETCEGWRPVGTCGECGTTCEDCGGDCEPTCYYNNCGHGTAVSALAASSGDDGFGSAGPAWGSPLMFADCFHSQYGYASNADIEDAAVMVMKAPQSPASSPRGAVILNMSLGSGDTPARKQSSRENKKPLVTYAAQRGALVVMSAGNSSVKNDDQLFSDALDPDNDVWRSHVLTVASTDRRGDAAWFTNEGQVIDLAAPGVSVTEAQRDGSLETGNGTSYSAPIAAGVAALTWTALGRNDPERVKEILMETAADPRFVTNVGAGVVDAQAAVHQAIQESGLAPDGVFASDPSTLKVFGGRQGDRVGGVFVLGDLDGDGAVEVMIGAPSAPADTVGGRPPGEAYLFFGVTGPVDTLNALNADVVLHGDGPADGFGSAAANVGDLDGDGLQDFAVVAQGDLEDPSGSPGAVYLFMGRDLDDLARARSGSAGELASWTISSSVERHLRGASVLGFRPEEGAEGHLLIGVPFAREDGLQRGAVYVFEAREEWEGLSLARADASYWGEADGDRSGSALSALGSALGGEAQVIAVGAPGHDGAGTDSGRVYLLLGPDVAESEGGQSLAQASATFNGESRRDYFGESIAAAGDLDRDERVDFMVGAPFADGYGVDQGAVYLFLGASSSLWQRDTPALFADASYYGEGSNDQAGRSMASLIEPHGGYQGVAIGAPGYGSGSGAVYLVSDPLSNGDCQHGVSLGRGSFKLIGDAPGDRFGSALDAFPVGDTLTFIVGAPYGELGAASDTGIVYVYEGPIDALIFAWQQSDADSAGCSTAPRAGSVLGSALLLSLAVFWRRRSEGVLLLVLGLIGGCAVSTGEPGSSEPILGQVEEVPVSDIEGTVLDIFGEPVPGASILVGEEQFAISEIDGYFSFPLEGEYLSEVIIQVEAEGHAPSLQVVPLSGSGGVREVRLISPVLEVEVELEPGVWNRDIELDGASLDIPPGLVYEETGRPVEGTVTLKALTFYPGKGHLPTPSLVEAGESGGPGPLMATLGMVGVWMESEGQRVNLPPGTKDLARIEIYGAERYTHGELGGLPFEIDGEAGKVASTAPLYHLADGEVFWTRENSQGWRVISSSHPDYALSFEAHVSHFTYWNIDVRVPSTCLIGQVFTRWSDGVDLHSDVVVAMRGYNRGGGEWHTWTSTGADGRYCQRIGQDTPNMEIWFDRHFEEGHYKVVRYGEIPVVAGQPDCGSAVCTVMDHEIPCGFFE